MDYQDHYRRRPLVRWRRGTSGNCLFTSLISFAGILLFIAPATSQRSSYPALNTPPILYVPDRNWRISETEQVGQIIARIRAEDAENDDLVFGLEPHFHSNYADPNDNGNNGVDGIAQRNILPFRIDPVVGVVYLNESLTGRAGENFFLYITVSDGQLTAKNEVFVNILGSGSSKKNFGSRVTPSIANAVHNISQFLPSFDQLPGVQSIRHQQANNRPINNLPPGYNINSFFSPQRPFPNRGDYIGNGFGSVTTDPQISVSQGFSTPHTSLMWPTRIVNDANDHNNKNNNNDEGESEDIADRPTSDKSDGVIPTATIRTKLIPVNTNKGLVSHAGVFKGPLKISGQTTEGTVNEIDNASTNVHWLQGATIPLIFAVCGFAAAAVAGFGFFFRQRLCAISKTLTKKSKAEMAKKSNQSNLSSNLTDDSRNSMVMQHWNGPMAFSNRYVPWERDQQMMPQNMATSQLSTSVVNGNGIISSNASALGVTPNGTIAASGIIGVGVSGGGNVAAPSHGDGIRSNGDRWEFPRHRLKFFNILGEGAFGQVWRCEAIDIDGLEGVTTVAVKTLKENAAEVEKNDLVSELQVMKSLQPHVNVVRLLGCCTEKDPLFVIIEYVNRGKLQTFLRNSRAERHYGNTHGNSNILTSGDLTSFMYQVAKGMDYLTSRGIIHRDLAARNILVTDDHICKVADFGFARDVITSKIYERKSEGKLPIRWMAIESLYDNIFSVKSDVWSFGILMWEIVTLGSTPYPGISAADVMRKVRDGYRLEKPEHCRRELYNIMYYCWCEDANERPTFSELVQMLDKLLHTEMDYIELERFPDHNYYNILNLSGEKL